MRDNSINRALTVLSKHLLAFTVVVSTLACTGQDEGVDEKASQQTGQADNEQTEETGIGSIAIENGDMDKLVSILAEDPDWLTQLNQSNNELTPLHYAVELGQKRVVLFLAPHMDSVDIRDTFDRTAMHVAARHGRTDSMQVLFRYGANVDAGDSDGNTPLHIALKNLELDAFKALLKAGADPTLENQYGDNPFKHARGFARVSKIYDLETAEKVIAKAEEAASNFE